MISGDLNLNKHQHNQALRALDSQQVARLCGERYKATIIMDSHKYLDNSTNINYNTPLMRNKTHRQIHANSP